MTWVGRTIAACFLSLTMFRVASAQGQSPCGETITYAEGLAWSTTCVAQAPAQGDFWSNKCFRFVAVQDRDLIFTVKDMNGSIAPGQFHEVYVDGTKIGQSRKTTDLWGCSTFINNPPPPPIQHARATFVIHLQANSPIVVRIRFAGYDGHSLGEIQDNGNCMTTASAAVSWAWGPPNDGDQDGDGLRDSWELFGIPVPGVSGALYTLDSCKVDHKDLYVEADAMASMAPTDTSITRLKMAFALALVPNPDGLTGIKLHYDRSNDQAIDSLSFWVPAGTEWPSKFDSLKAAHFGSVAERAHPQAANYLAARSLAFRYCIFARTLNVQTPQGWRQWTGLSRSTPGSDFLISLIGPTSAPTENKRKGTFMHELGHCLGLRHGGKNDPTDNKPNFVSVMNLAMQFPAVNAHGREMIWLMDYSRNALPSLNESLLLEGDGIGGDPKYPALIGPRTMPGRPRYVKRQGPVDYSNNGSIDVGPVPVDLNFIDDFQISSPGDFLVGKEDWSNLVYAPTAGTGVGYRLQRVAEGEGPEHELSAEDIAIFDAAVLDCNDNAVHDVLEPDSNGNGIPDECEGGGGGGGGGGGDPCWPPENPPCPQEMETRGGGAAVEVRWYDISGRRVVRPESPGVYFRATLSNGRIITKKMVILR